MNFKQKIDPQAGITQLSGSGSPENSTVGYVGQTYRNTDNNDLYEKATGDGTNTGWVQKTGAGATVPDATELQAGKVELANQAEAEAGTDDTNKAMNPLKTKQAINAYSSAKIISSRFQENETSYNANIDIKTPTALTTESSITYSNGIYTVGKNCKLLISAVISFRNNGGASDDNSFLRVSKSTDNGSTFAYIAYLDINPSNLTSSSQNLVQTIIAAANFNDGDQFKVDITGVNATQFYTNAIVTATEI